MQKFKKLLLLVIFIVNSCIFSNSNLKIFYSSIPKCGNFLLMKCLKLITNKKIIPSYNRLYLNNAQINSLSNNFILDSHAFCNKENEYLIAKNNLKGFFIYRDPRDQLVSFIYYIHFLYKTNIHFRKSVNLEKYSKLSFDDLFFKIIDNYNLFYTIWNINYNIKPLKHGKLPNKKNNITTVYKQYENWKKNKKIYITTFEKLVGPQGGGNLTMQIKEIKNIARHINIYLSDNDAKKIAEQLFGDTSTFRKGQIGSWRKLYTKKHKDAFKKVAGQLLIDLGYEKDLNW